MANGSFRTQTIPLLIFFSKFAAREKHETRQLVKTHRW
jgi:hypothetical protein